MREIERERQGVVGHIHLLLYQYPDPVLWPLPPFPCCPIQICCNEYFAEDVNRFLDGGCRSSSVFCLRSSVLAWSLFFRPIPQSPIPHRIPILRRIIIFIMCMQSAVCSESSAFDLRSSALLFGSSSKPYGIYCCLFEDCFEIFIRLSESLLILMVIDTTRSLIDQRLG